MRILKVITLHPKVMNQSFQVISVATLLKNAFSEIQLPNMKGLHCGWFAQLSDI